MREFKFYPEDFGALPVAVLHMDLVFDMHEDHTKVTSDMKVVAKKDLIALSLNAKNLDIHTVSSTAGACTYVYDKEHSFLTITFKKPIKKNTEFIVHTQTTCRPTKNILEGLYYDETPKGCPCQQITQCQQWGFQRIVPCFDDMTAKCTYTTTIIADVNYTHLLTNGDVAKPRKNDAKRATIVYNNTKTPMAPYLFFLGVGTYAGFTRELEYANGKKFMLELLVPPKSDAERAKQALQVLYDAIQWIHIFTGPNTYEHVAEKEQLWKLLKQRDAATSAEKETIRKQMQKLVTYCTGYQYTGTMYREIGMQNSNFGGMENVGNTTITTNRIMPFKDMTDGGLEYMASVKAHEFYHNLNGSEVTGRSPFEIWLNEAVTVYIEQAFHAYFAGEEYARLGQVLHLIGPDGTLEEDEGTAIMPIEPDGFNNPDELITGVTYVKAPEFVRMIKEVIGKETFAKGLAAYHAKFKHSNASRADWITAMEEASGKDLKRMAHVWLKQTGFPTVTVTRKITERSVSFDIAQIGYKKEMHYEFPFEIVLCDADGKTIAEKRIWVQKPKAKITFDITTIPAFISINRRHVMYGKVIFDASDEELYAQATKDPDVVNRFLAFYTIADREKMSLLKKSKPVSKSFIHMYGRVLQSVVANPALGSLPLSISEGVEDKAYAHKYQELYDVRRKIRLTLAQAYKTKLEKIYSDFSKKTSDSDDFLIQTFESIKLRQIKNAALGILSELDTPEIHVLIKKQYLSATTATDEMLAFRLYIESSAKDKHELLHQHEKSTIGNLVRHEIFLANVSASDTEDVISLLETLEKSPHVRLEQSNDQRALYFGFAYNKRLSLLTESGRNFILARIKKLTPINEYTVGHLLGIFGHIDYLDEEHHIPVVQMLIDILDSTDKEKYPGVHNTTLRLLKGAKKAVATYTKKKAKIPYLN